MAEGKEKVVRRQYTEEFQLEAVRLADSVGLNAAADRLGEPPRVSRRAVGLSQAGMAWLASRRQ